MIAGLSAGFGFPAIVQLVSPAAPMGDLAFRLLGVLAIAVAVAVTRVRSPVGRRVAGLVATGLLPSLAVTIPLRGDPAVFLVPVLVSLLAAVLVWPVAIVSWRGRVGGHRARATTRAGVPGVRGNLPRNRVGDLRACGLAALNLGGGRGTWPYSCRSRPDVNTSVVAQSPPAGDDDGVALRRLIMARGRA